MSIKLPLHEMTIQEKLAAMESLWEDLSRSSGAIQSPEWHKEILDQRRQQVAAGTARFVDWGTAKAEIRDFFDDNWPLTIDNFPEKNEEIVNGQWPIVICQFTARG